MLKIDWDLWADSDDEEEGEGNFQLPPNFQSLMGNMDMSNLGNLGGNFGGDECGCGHDHGHCGCGNDHCECEEEEEEDSDDDMPPLEEI